ncbi:unnamed protein product, partial [Wuchereria bancrofti]
ITIEHSQSGPIKEDTKTTKKHNNRQRDNHLNKMVIQSTCCSVQNEDQTTVTPIVDTKLLGHGKNPESNNLGLCFACLELLIKRFQNDECLLKYGEMICGQLQPNIIGKVT